MRPTLFPPCPPARNRSPLPAEPVNSPLDDPGTALAPRPGMACPLRLRHPLYLFGLTERSLPACGMKTLPYWLRFGDYFLAGPNPRDSRYGIYDYKNAPCPKGSTPAVRPNQAR